MTAGPQPKPEDTDLSKMRMYLVLFPKLKPVLPFLLPELRKWLELMLLKACLTLSSSCVLGFSAEPANLSVLAPQDSVQLEYLSPLQFQELVHHLKGGQGAETEGPR